MYETIFYQRRRYIKKDFITMKQTLLTLLMLCSAVGVSAQYRPRPDAFPPVEEDFSTKSVTMATTVEEMADWDRYPTYETYLAMMSRWAETYPTLCHVDTIGTSVQDRLILSMYIEVQTDDDLYRPEFFYSSTIHGDEVTGYVMMLRLIDTLLSSYGSSPELTALVNSTRISINPLANPDGTYYRGNNTVQRARRANANGVDLNRNYPNPFAPAKAALAQENRAMMDYFESHNFRLSANLHGGAEVMNYPWDSYTSAQNPHPEATWWREVGRRFVDTVQSYAPTHFTDVQESDNGVVAGGDWYVITGGRQDYVNATYNCLEMTMEISVDKTLSSNRLPEYWHFLAPSFINYIKEIHNLPASVGIDPTQAPGYAAAGTLHIYPNPATDRVVVDGLVPGERLWMYDMQGRLTGCYPSGAESTEIDIKKCPQGVYLLRTEGRQVKLVVER